MALQVELNYTNVEMLLTQCLPCAVPLASCDAPTGLIFECFLLSFVFPLSPSFSLFLHIFFLLLLSPPSPMNISNSSLSFSPLPVCLCVAGHHSGAL